MAQYAYQISDTLNSKYLLCVLYIAYIVFQIKEYHRVHLHMSSSWSGVFSISKRLHVLNIHLEYNMCQVQFIFTLAYIFVYRWLQNCNEKLACQLDTEK